MTITHNVLMKHMIPPELDTRSSKFDELLVKLCSSKFLVMNNPKISYVPTIIDPAADYPK
jgi:hypothetical protein